MTHGIDPVPRLRNHTHKLIALGRVRGQAGELV
jgi:hypothetical protein